MMQRSRWALGAHLLLVAVVAMLVWAAPRPVAAQVQQGATMTVLRGQVAVVRGGGSAIQPAPSGTIVQVGDEIRTLSQGGALVTFFAGTEIEMGEETVMAIDQIERSGDRVNVSLRQVFGASVHRVQTVTGSDSTYRVEAGGAVALVRGTTFAIVGPFPSPVGNLVVLVCLEDCGPESTFAQCHLMPNTAIGVVVGEGQLRSGCASFGVAPGAGFLDSADETLTNLERRLGDPNEGTVPRVEGDESVPAQD